MPVVRSRSGFRIEAGRGYPRLKWSDINKSTLIANELQLAKDGRQLASGAVKNSANRPGIGSPALPEWTYCRRDGVLIQSDGESEESSSDNSLIYSDFQLSPECGSVRMAFTVPLTQLKSPLKYEQPVFKSTFQIKQTIVERGKRSEGRKQSGVRDKVTRPSTCSCTNNNNHEDTKNKHLSKKNARSTTSIQKLDKQSQKTELLKVCTKQAKVLKEPINIETNINKSVSNSSLYTSPGPPTRISDHHANKGINNSSAYTFPGPATRDSSHYPANPRQNSFWNDIKAGRKGCLASQKTRPRDATFIIYTSDSETSVVKERRRKLPRNPTYIIERDVGFPSPSEGVTGSLPANQCHSAHSTRHDPRPLHSVQDLTSRRVGQGFSLSSSSSSTTTMKMTRPFEVRYYQGRAVIPVTFTSDSHPGVRCYPPLVCHPSPECHPFHKPFDLSPWHHCRYCHANIPIKCHHHHHHALRELTPSGGGRTRLKKSASNSANNNDLGLTIRNRYANMDSADDLEVPQSVPQSQSVSKSVSQSLRHLLGLSHKTRDMTPPSSLLSVAEFLMGQRSSSGSGAVVSKRLPVSAPPVPSSPALSQVGTPKQSPSTPSSGNTPPSSGNTPPSSGNTPPSTGKTKKVVKTTLRETAAKKTLQSRTKSSASNSTGGYSPASLHGRVLQKTASVSPAPPPKPSGNHSTSLTRFGFKSSPLITSGESTDSVNSILSDAQTVSDTNSNIFDFAEENENLPSDLLNSSQTQTKHTKDSSNVRSLSPCTISQASSGVTSTLLNGKIKAQTKQLPVPQVITVKTMSTGKKKTSPTNTLKNRYSSPVSRKEVSPQRSPLIMSKDCRSKIPQTSSKSSLPKATRVSRDSESSNKSLSTVDSGLGSSSESDKLRLPLEPLLPKTADNSPSQRSKHNENERKENGFELDVSDAWLKDKLVSKTEPGTLGLHLKERSSPFVPDKSFSKESFKEKRDSNITYGMARQKFAPYNRNRLLYHNASPKPPSTQTTTTAVKQDAVSTTTKLSDLGTVRSRIALLEKTPLIADKDISPPQQIPKKPVARPTSFEKTPILVSSKTENTVELSRSICRRLEYSEGKGTLLDTLKDNKIDGQLIEVPTTVQEFLMVDSFEVKKEVDSPILENNEISVTLPNKKSIDSDNENSECKRIKDISECENSTKRLSNSVNRISLNSEGEINDIDARDVPLPDSTEKLFSPADSEQSFEVLESESLDDSSPSKEETNRMDTYLTQLVAGFAKSSIEPSSSAKHSHQSSPNRVTPLKKCRQDSDCKESVRKCQEKEEEDRPVDDDETLDKWEPLVIKEPIQASQIIIKEPIQVSQAHPTDTSHTTSLSNSNKSVMETSVESNRSTDTNRMSDSGDRWTISGKCTPTLSSTRGDVDQDFLIDDEISDQPGLTFGDELDDSFFRDEDLFSDMSSVSASHLMHKTERSRHESMGTTSSIGADDLMLDYDLEDTKQMGQRSSSLPPTLPHPKGAHTPPPKHPTPQRNSEQEAEGPHSDILEFNIPGPRYDEEVLSPVACDILSEWSAILSDAHAPRHSASSSSVSQQQQCISQNTVGLNTAATTSLSFGSTPSQTTDITHQPLSNGKDYLEDCALSRTSSFNSRSRTASTGSDLCTAEAKKGVNFKPPRQCASAEQPDGGINIDRTNLHYICQDVTAMKTLLLRLRRVIQVADTINPFDANLKTSLYLSLGANECSEREEPLCSQDVMQQNVDLKRQVVLLQQRLEEKDRSIRSLQQQLSRAMQQIPSPCGGAELRSSSSPVSSSSSSSSTDGGDITPTPKPVANAATQTERFGQRTSPFSLSSMSRTSSIEDGLGPTVSSENSNVRSLLTDCAPVALPSEKEGKRDTPLKKKFPSEFLVTPSAPKLSLVPSTSAVAGSLTMSLTS